MKKILVEYSQIIGMAFTGLVFAFSSFLILLNFYHYKEVNTTYEKSAADEIIRDQITKKLQQAESNLSGFDVNSYTGLDSGIDLSTIQTDLKYCVKLFNDEEITKILSKPVVNIADVYNFQRYFQNTILSECIVKRTYNLTLSGNEQRYKVRSLSTIAPFLKMHVDDLLEDTSFLIRLVENNSNYSVSSDYSKQNFTEMTRDSYNEFLNSYSKSADYILQLSYWFKTTTGGQ